MVFAPLQSGAMKPPFGRFTVACLASSKDEVVHAESHCPGRSTSGLLSWDSPRCSPPSASLRASTPEPKSLLNSAFGFEPPARSLVPSLWFFTTSTACSARSLRACCIPLPTLGFAAFPGLASRRCRLDAWDHFPRRESHPSKNSPPLQPFHVAVVVASLPLSAPFRRSPLQGPSNGTMLAQRPGQSAHRSVRFCASSHTPRQRRFQRCRFVWDLAGSRLRGLSPLESP